MAIDGSDHQIKEIDRTAAVIVAAGRSARMGNDKLFAKLGGMPLLSRTVEVFQRCPEVDDIVIVLNESNFDLGRRLVEGSGWWKVRQLCLGGERRQDSVWHGLCSLQNCKWIIVHDGARPFVSEHLIRCGLAEAKQFGAAIAGVPVKDTIKIVDARGIVLSTPERSGIWVIQTPQVFRYDLITAAYQEGTAEVTDEATLLECQGHPVKVYMGSYDNIKITTPEDWTLAEMILKRQAEAIR
ncbi:MAG: 2-C-methyl-D-erythritol 4-phosphate cytidylyltransferase [Chloroflexi bacterium]|nr:2-C-methyl-D-erythritol 4-phosphate cytidylyltransferase [Chloroflexota bacterium]MCL5074979.1 2-C-methyl-D-erythritol 4-phosphate cytidylyltransferase [Chloroflexota bacterium]